MKNVLITGGNKGIGFETVRQLADQGYFVYFGSRDMEKGKTAERELHASGLQNTAVVQLDVTDATSISEATSWLEEQLTALDVLINNAAIAGGQPQTLSEGDTVQLRQLFDTNFFGTVATTQAMLPLLRRADRPVILNVSSELGSLNLQQQLGAQGDWVKYHAYGATKTALNALTIALSNELKASGFRVNSVSPGYTATDLNDYQGTKSAADGARLIVERATAEDDSTGTFFTDDGMPGW